jgi:hypothetical protein
MQPAGAYHAAMIKDGTMAANAVTTGVIECELDTGAEKSSMMDGTPPSALPTKSPRTFRAAWRMAFLCSSSKSKAVLRATYNGKTTNGMAMSSPTALPVFVGKFARDLATAN